jgi:hypothetical protein
MSLPFRQPLCAAAAAVAVCVAAFAPASAQSFPKSDADQILDHNGETPARIQCGKFLAQHLRNIGSTFAKQYPDLTGRNLCLYAKQAGYRGKIE